MLGFKELTDVNGFDLQNLNNARQNNYAWSMSELGEYIYVGTGRNILLTIIKSIEPNIQIPISIKADPIDNLAEIWRYKKDGTLPWERVYKAPVGSGIMGFRFMIQDRPFNGNPCIYAATFGVKAQILKTTNGVNWFILNDTVLQGTSSRAMVIKDNKVYLATINEVNPSATPLLYSSKDPEFYPWKLVIDSSKQDFDIENNPKGAISNMEVFNNKIYVATSNADGVQVWRTNGSEPEMNQWTLIVDKGFGDSANKYSLSIGVFKNHLYVSGTKQLPLAWAIPMGCDIIRIDKKDNWELVVGGRQLQPSTPSKGARGKNLSGLGSGFNNPFNVYAWQIQEYKGKLLISTFDDSTNMELILEILLANRVDIEETIGDEITEILIRIYKDIVRILNKIKYPFGFDLYVSEDGVHFNPVFLNGLGNRYNYGGRILFVDKYNELYIGTANPYEGCEVWRTRHIDYCDFDLSNRENYGMLYEVREEMNNNYKALYENVRELVNLMENNNYHILFR